MSTYDETLEDELGIVCDIAPRIVQYPVTDWHLAIIAAGQQLRLTTRNYEQDVLLDPDKTFSCTPEQVHALTDQAWPLEFEGDNRRYNQRCLFAQRWLLRTPINSEIIVAQLKYSWANNIAANNVNLPSSSDAALLDVWVYNNAGVTAPESALVFLSDRANWLHMQIGLRPNSFLHVDSGWWGTFANLCDRQEQIQLGALLTQCTVKNANWVSGNAIWVVFGVSTPYRYVSRGVTFATLMGANTYALPSIVPQLTFATIPVVPTPPSGTYDVAVSSDVDLLQDVTFGIFPTEVVSDTLDIVMETAAQLYLTDQNQHSLTIQQTITAACATITIQDVTDYLTVNHIVGSTLEHRSMDVTVTSILNLEQVTDAGYLYTHTLEDYLTLTQTVSGVTTKDGSVEHELVLDQEHTHESDYYGWVQDVVTLVQTVSGRVSSNRSIEDELTLTHVIASAVDGVVSENEVCRRRDSIYVGGWTLPARPTLQMTGTFELTYDSVTVTLPAPDFNNQESFQPDRINRKTVGNEVHVFADPAWGITVTYKYTFSRLTRQQRLDLLSLFDRCLGQPVEILDHEGRSFNALILNPNTDLTDHLAECGHAVAFDLGVLQ